MKYLSNNAMEKILKEKGAKRVSEEAKEEFRKQLEKIAERTAEKAVLLSKHAGRRTVKREDIELAFND